MVVLFLFILGLIVFCAIASVVGTVYIVKKTRREINDIVQRSIENSPRNSVDNLDINMDEINNEIFVDGELVLDDQIQV